MDVGATREGQRVAFEVVQEGTLLKEVSNYDLDIADGWHSVVFCVGSSKVAEALRQRLPAGALAEVKLLQDLLT